MNTCPICGKLTVIHWPDLYPYVRGPVYYCSWQCMDISICRDTAMIRYRVLKRRQKKVTQVMTAEQKQEAIRLALEGKDPRPWMKECGSKAPDKLWSYIKSQLKKNDPETYAKIPKFGDKMVVISKSEESLLVAPKELQEKYNFKPIEDTNRDEFEITAVRHKNYGEFYYDHDHNCIDWRTPEGDEMSMGITGWKNLIDDLPVIMKKLGVEL